MHPRLSSKLKYNKKLYHIYNVSINNTKMYYTSITINIVDNQGTPWVRPHKMMVEICLAVRQNTLNVLAELCKGGREMQSTIMEPPGYLELHCTYVQINA